MEFRLEQINTDKFEWQETLSFDVGQMDRSGLSALGDVECRGRIDVLESGYALQVLLDYEQTLACVRCLAPLVQPVETAVKLWIVIKKPQDDIEVELGIDDLGVLTLPEPVLNTTPLVGEQVQLGIPMKSLCREDCAGLCGKCGSDLNIEACQCQQPTDPRWAALSALKPDTSS